MEAPFTRPRLPEAVPDDWDVNSSALVTSNEPEKIFREYDYLHTNCPVAHVDRHGGYWVLTM